LLVSISASSLFELHSIKTCASVQRIRIQYGRRLSPEEKPNRKKKKGIVGENGVKVTSAHNSLSACSRV
jgi:hypothetical protein